MHTDPFVGFSDQQPLFVHDAEAGEYRIAPARLEFFVEDSFPSPKPPGTYRIFCLGGSTVQGRPFAKETSFTTWLELALREADPSRRWEVVNCGGISYASYRLVPILQECLDYEPDLVIVCTGHNEFLEDRTYGAVRDRPGVLAKPHHYLARLRIYHVYRQLLRKLTERSEPLPAPATLGSEVDALLDYRNGIEAYHRDPAWRAGVIRHYEFNLARMACIARHAGVPLVFVLPPSNLADTPPFKSEHRADLTKQERARIEELLEEARAQPPAARQKAIALCKAASELDPRHAGLHFHLGKLHELQGQFDQARREFHAARDEDVCPLRILQPMEESLREVARAWSVPLLDAHQLLESRTQHGILDNSILVDHIHPSVKGHKRIGLALVETLETMGIIEPASDWRADAQQTFQQHLDSLSTFYFFRGQQRLQSLQAWSHGRADGEPIESRGRKRRLKKPVSKP
ncbi:MAG: GDSL-type esterase/lipase family protein [Planctomycetota bacterium]